MMMCTLFYFNWAITINITQDEKTSLQNWITCKSKLIFDLRWNFKRFFLKNEIMIKCKLTPYINHVLIYKG